MTSIPLCTQPGFDDASGRGLYNSLGQSPCYIATALFNLCNPAPLNLPPLGPGYYNYNPTVSNRCLCSTVTYSLLSACSYCQTLTFNSWPGYSSNCTSTDISLSSFPQPIPAGTSIPHYGYLDVVTSGTFNVTAALSAGGAESSPISSILSATSTVRTGSSTALTSATTTSTSDSTKGRSTIVIGATVGLVVGFLLLVLVLGLVWFCKFRGKRAISVQKLPSEQLLQRVKQHSRQSGDQHSLLSAKEYSLLGSPPRPSRQPLEMVPVGVA